MVALSTNITLVSLFGVKQVDIFQSTTLRNSETMGIP
jgi:hypothetical protein